MSDYLLADRAEQAFVNILTVPVRTALGLTAADANRCVAGRSSSVLQIPGVVCECEVGEEETKDTANFWVDAIISVLFHASDPADKAAVTKPAAQALLSAVNNAVYVDNLDAQLTDAVEQFHVFASSVQRLGGGRRTYDAERSCWIDSIHFRFLACAADLS